MPLLGGKRFFATNIQRLSQYRNAMNSFFEKYPKTASAFTGFCTFGAGDVIAQRVEMHNTTTNLQFDYARPFQVGMLGFFMNGLFLTQWYNLLERVIGTSMHCKRAVFMKVAADQIIYGPFSIIAFFSFTSFLAHDNIPEMLEQFSSKMQDRFITTFLADCSLWPLANFVNFRLVPLVYRPTFTSVVQLVWQTYLSFVSSTPDEHAVQVYAEGKEGQEPSSKKV